MRITWIQPEDLVGHELRQAREEGKDVDDVEQRWFDAGGAPAPGRGASQEPVAPALRTLALELLDELDALLSPLASDEPEGFEEILAQAEPAATRAPVDVEERIAGAWLGRAAGCVLGKPVENVPREGIRAIAEATGNWPVVGWFTAEGLPPEVSERWPWNRASRPTSLAELRSAFAPFDSVGEHYAAPVLNARIPSRLHAIEELPIAVGLLVATGGDYEETVLGGVNYGRDSDSIASMGGALAGALGNPVRRDWVEDVSAASKIDVEEAGRTMAGLAVEIFERDSQRHQERARALAALTAGEVPA